MREELLHFIWQSKLLMGKTLTTTLGEPITILQLGTYNTNAGPDFFNAKLQIGSTIWAGNVEMHISSSEWDKHNHQQDTAYNNVILHVVYVDDKKIVTADNQTLPTIELRSIIPSSLLQRYQSLQQQQYKYLPCEKIIEAPSAIVLNNWLQRLLIERLEQKCDYIKEILAKTQHHYEQCFYIITARYFGMKTNSQPFEQLAFQLPLSILAKHKNSLSDSIALVLGVSGLLPQMGNPYAELIPKFEHFKQKYNLSQMDPSIWKFARTRPANFPTERLLQFAALIYQSSHLLGKILECDNIQQLKKLYAINAEYNNQKIKMGNSAIQLLLVNSVLPFVFLYGKLQHQQALCDKALLWYEQLPAEKNTTILQYTSLGLPAKNAADAQAYIQLKTQYCKQLKCLQCSIGYHSLLHV